MPKSAEFCVGQGYEMNRPSLLYVKVVKCSEEVNETGEGFAERKTHAKKENIMVQVGGYVVPVLTGGTITLR